MGYYRKQAICLNGHQISDHVEPASEYHDKFCYKCGASIVTECQKCNHQIDGDYYSSEIIVLSNKLSAMRWYCSNCGDSYPWTKSLIANAVAIAELDDLDSSDIETIKQELPNVLVESQQTPLAKAKILRAAKKMTDSTKSFMRDLLKDVIVEVTIKQMFGN